MEIIVHILLGAVLSFIGSIPFGTINVTVIETAIRRGLRSALWVTLGAAIIEFIQAIVALFFSGLISQNPQNAVILNWVSIPIFIGFGIYYLRQDSTQDDPAALHGYSRGKGFLKGVIVACLNVLAIPYWVFYGTYLSSIGWIRPQDRMMLIVFCLGVLSGTILILFTYARLALYAKSKFHRITQWISPVIAYFLSGTCCRTDRANGLLN